MNKSVLPVGSKISSVQISSHQTKKSNHHTHTHTKKKSTYNIIYFGLELIWLNMYYRCVLYLHVMSMWNTFTWIWREKNEYSIVCNASYSGARNPIILKLTIYHNNEQQQSRDCHCQYVRSKPGLSVLKWWRNIKHDRLVWCLGFWDMGGIRYFWITLFLS